MQDHTQLAPALGLQIGVRADVGDVDVGGQGCVQNALALFRLDLGPIDPQFHLSHVTIPHIL